MDFAFATLESSLLKQVRSLDSLVPEEDHHLSSFFDINTKTFRTSCDKNKYYDFYKANYTAIVNKLNDVIWDELFDSSSVTANVLNVPNRQSRYNSYPVWYSKELISSIIIKKKSYTVYLYNLTH